MRSVNAPVFGSVLLAAALQTAHGNAAGPSAASPMAPPAAQPQTLPTAMSVPTNIVFSQDPAKCSAWRPASPWTGTVNDPCKDIVTIPNSGVFHWDWRGNAAHPAAIGFRLYRAASRNLVLETRTGTESNTALVYGDAKPGQCFTVTAWDLTAESDPSGEFCLAPNLPIVAQAPTHRGTPLGAAVSPMVLGGRGIPAPSQPLPFKHPAEVNDPANPKPTVCTVHGGFAGGLACLALLPRGGIALVWDYGPGHIDGFRAYSVPNPRVAPTPVSRAVATRLTMNAPVATQTARLENGQVATLVVLDGRPGGFGNECFTVTAFLGAEESPMSPSFCLAP
jgi:hypothetical protein